ncbi:MAG: MOSC domain-containing protein [Alphaproteobacteria bacterium]|nr:MOSC domain-containing protein [Alphaproteobacteria bacterium]
MKLLSVNVSLPKTIEYQGRSITTGIFKEPVQGRVLVRALNLKGDGQADLESHGGQHKAIYAYPFEHYADWAAELGRDDFTHGQFGENFTTEGLLEDTVYIGDRFRIGDATFEVTQPRVPCFKLAMKMDLESFPKRFLASGRTGFYMRVLEEGDVAAGDTIERVGHAGERVSVREVNGLMFQEKANLEGAVRVLRVPALAPGWCAVFEKRLLAAGMVEEELPRSGCKGGL